MIRLVWLCGVLLVVLMSCAEIKPNTGGPSHHRDNPPGPGLLTGEEGKFVIFRR